MEIAPQTATCFDRSSRLSVRTAVLAVNMGNRCSPLLVSDLLEPIDRYPGADDNTWLENSFPIVTVKAEKSETHIVLNSCICGKNLAFVCLKFYSQQIASPIHRKCSINHFPSPRPPENPIFNGTTFGIWLWHRDLNNILAPFHAFSHWQNLPPNFLGSHRLLSATNSVLSY